MKEIRIKNFAIIGILIFSGLTFSCSDFLNIVPDNTATVDHAFKKRHQAENYLYGIYGFLPTFSGPAKNPAILAGEESWLFDDFKDFGTSSWEIAKGNQGTQSPLCNYWASESSRYSLNGGDPVFTAIRDCNIFLENINKTIDLSEYERELWIAEVKTLKAFFHFWLFNMYGPIPIIDKNIEISSSSEETMYYREPVDSVLNYMIELIDSASVYLPLNIMDVAQDMGRITRPMALSLKAKILTYAASPLFNGNSEHTNVVDSRGVKIFSQSYDPAKWTRASIAIKEAIDVCHEAGHALFDFNNLPEASIVSKETLLSMQTKGAATERWNPEIIWGDTQSDTYVLQRFAQPAFIHWNTNGNITFRSWAPTLRTVEQFYTKNGIPIEEDKEWININPYSLRTADQSHKYYIEPNYTTVNLHFNREPRFYGAIAFDGGKFYGNGVLTDDAMLTSKFLLGSYNIAWFQNRHSATGYLAKKMIHRLSSVSQTAGTFTIYRYTFPVIRLADLYLLYAETLNEIKQSPDSEVYKYIDLVRNRTGLEGVIESWRNHSTNPEKPLSKDGMREIIQRERMIELAFEGQRYWDLRRWKLLKEYMNMPIQGWNITSRETVGFYKVQTLAFPKFEEKDYLWPIRQENILKNRKLIQNPGWQ